MADLSISTAWNETADFVKRNGGALFTIAFALVALPNVAMQALAKGQLVPGGAVQPGLWLFLALAAIVLSVVGTLAISALAVGRQEVVGRAISHGFGRFAPVFAATLLVALAAAIIFLPFMLALGLDLEAVTAPTSETAGRFLLALLLFTLIFLFLWVRLMLVTPVGAAEAGGPVAILRRSWALTAGHMGKLLGFVIVFLVAAIVLVLVATLLFGIVVALIAGPPNPGSVSALLMLLLGGVINAVFAVYFTTMVARIYAQLAAGAPSASH